MKAPGLSCKAHPRILDRLSVKAERESQIKKPSILRPANTAKHDKSQFSFAIACKNRCWPTIDWPLSVGKFQLDRNHMNLRHGHGRYSASNSSVRKFLFPCFFRQASIAKSSLPDRASFERSRSSAGAFEQSNNFDQIILYQTLLQGR